VTNISLRNVELRIKPSLVGNPSHRKGPPVSKAVHVVGPRACIGMNDSDRYCAMLIIACRERPRGRFRAN